MRIILAILLLVTLHGIIHCQNIITNLYGFELGQFRDVTFNELGKVIYSDKYEDGFEYEAFLLKSDTSLYIVFEYAPSMNNVIWSIQLTGMNGETNFGTTKLNLGMDKSEVEKILGKPSEIKSIDNIGHQWSYQNQNYSVEISLNGKLSSIKIKDTYSQLQPEVSVKPKFEDVIRDLNVKTNQELMSLLAPDIEIYYEGKTFAFHKSLGKEIITDESKVFETLSLIKGGLEKIDVKDTSVYEENIRFMENHFPMHVIKIKQGHRIKELVLKYSNGKYLIWEIKT